MSVRLNKACKECNVGLQTLVEFLQKKGFKEVEADPNARITDEQYELVQAEFNGDAGMRQQAQRLTTSRKAKEKKETIVLTDTSEAVPVVEVQKPKVVGRIELDKKGNPVAPKAKEPEETPVKTEAPVTPEVKEAPQTQPVTETVEAPKAPAAEDKAEAPTTPEKPDTAESQAPSEPVEKKPKKPKAPIGEEVDGIFRITQAVEPPVSFNIKGHIDLDSINSSTRPAHSRKRKKGAAGTQKKRGERVDVAAEAIKQTSQGGQGSGQKGQKPAQGKGQGKGQQQGKGQAGQQPQGEGKNRRRKNQPKQAVVDLVEQSDEEVAKQVRETLARLTSGKNKSLGKGAKYRREKRDSIRSEMEAEMEAHEKEAKILKLTEFVTANELANMMNVPVTQVIATCMSIGIMVSINQRMDAETINLVAEEFGFQTEYVSADVSEAVHEDADDEADLVPRAPIVTVMGHVDHGKTSLLDYIRKTNVIAGEAGGITQHIGAYNVKLEDGRHITFLDTPGHEAFTAMRARGAQVTDIAIIIIAADDDIMPQTKEAINHAMAAGVPIVFAINKIDKPAANPEKIKEHLAQMNFLVEDWGGKYQSQDISAKKGLGVPELMEKVLLEAEMLELKANPNRKGTGSIIESSLDKGRGYVATLLCSNGTLHVGDILLAGTNYGRIKAMFNERGQRVKKIGPSEAATILGLNGAPTAGDTFHVMDTDQEAREIATKREQLAREQGLRTQKILTLDEIGRRIEQGGFQELNVIVKGDVDGSIEALSDSLIKLSTDKIAVRVIHKAVGQISESDVALAAASEAIIIGFQVRPSANARKAADTQGVEIRLYSIIYDAIEEVKEAMEGMLAPEVREEVTATIEVRQVYHISKVGTVAGAYVIDGKVARSNKVRVIRDGIVVHTGDILALKRFKDDVKEVSTNFECGISIANYNDLREGDTLEAYQEIEVKAKL
ncbi:MAG: translation initiation factor IF-2 [Bacteroidaceae bacterium]|nr:translation initiation factor IF-2 [Bacteroidaceae bacterium]